MYHDKTTMTLLTAGLLTVLSLVGATAAEQNNGIALNYTAATDGSGNCTPKRKDWAYIGDTGLFAVRGDADYVLPDGTTSIPFQAVYKWPNDEGMAKDRATTLLNYPGSCAELTIRITIEYCEYRGENGIEERACPAIVVNGADQFAGIELIRAD